MRPTLTAFIILTALLTHAQSNENGRPEGRITGTVVNDEGDPINRAVLCTTITQENQNSSSTSCGSVLTDKNGQFEIKHMPMGEIGVSADKMESGYWDDDRKSRMQTVNLTREEPVAHVILKCGHRPGELIVAVRNRATGKPMESFTLRWIADSREMSSGTGNFERSGTSDFRVPIRPATDVIVEVSSPGYKKWFYIDPSNPSQPTLRVQSGEQRLLNVEMEPQAKDAPTEH